MTDSHEKGDFHRASERFRDSELERKYRDDHLRSDKRSATIFISLAYIPVLVALVFNIIRLVNDPNDQLVIPTNIIHIIFVIAVISGFLFAVQIASTFGTFDRILFLYMSTLGALIAANQYFQPVDFVGTIYLLYFLNNFQLMPTPLRVQILPSILVAGFIAATLILMREPSYQRETTNALITIGSIMLIGSQASLLMGRFRRERYLNAIMERNTRTHLEDTLARIKTLSGIVPICSLCLKIRDEDGGWKKTEIYIQEHTEAEFSHGYCPQCAEKALDDINT